MREHKTQGSAHKAGKRRSSSEEVAGKVIVSDNLSRSRLLSASSLRYAGIALALVFVVGVAYLSVKAFMPTASSKVCGDDIAQQANTANKMGNVTEFTYIAGRVKGLPKYDKDPNCVYILTEYAMVNNDFSTAKANIGHLTSTYGTKYMFNKNLDDGKASVANLQNQYDIAKQAHDNANGVIDPAI